MEVVGTLAVVYFINEFYLPVFYDLQFSSIFEVNYYSKLNGNDVKDIQTLRKKSN